MTLLEDLKLSEVAQAITAVAGVFLGASFGLQRLLKSWKENSAGTDIITLMHQELERLGIYNKTMSLELGSLQAELISLNKQIRNLSSENQSLHNEVSSLTTEVSRLTNLLSN